MIKKREVALETAGELFLTAFNGEIPEHGVLEKVAEAECLVDPQTRWFRQTFTGLTKFELFAGISGKAAEALPSELAELIDSVFRAMVIALGALAGSAISCGALTEEGGPRGLESIPYQLRRESADIGEVVLCVPDATLSILSDLIHAGTRSTPLHFDALMNVDLPVSIRFGATEMVLADVLKLTTGSIVEFNHLLNEPVNVVVNDCLVARGAVVIVDGNYGVRISEVVTHA